MRNGAFFIALRVGATCIRGTNVEKSPTVSAYWVERNVPPRLRLIPDKFTAFLFANELTPSPILFHL